jgi:hypothetical protein
MRRMCTIFLFKALARTRCRSVEFGEKKGEIKPPCKGKLDFRLAQTVCFEWPGPIRSVYGRRVAF